MKNRTLRISIALIIIINLLFIFSENLISLQLYRVTYRYDTVLFLINLLAIGLALFCLFKQKHYSIEEEPPQRRTHNIIMLIASAVTALSFIVFFVLAPKYTVQQACSIVKANRNFSYADILQPDNILISDEQEGNWFQGFYSLYWKTAKNTRSKITVLFESRSGKILYSFPNHLVSDENPVTFETDYFTASSEDGYFNFLDDNIMYLGLHFNDSQLNPLVSSGRLHTVDSSREAAQAVLAAMSDEELKSSLAEAAQCFLDLYNQEKAPSMTPLTPSSELEINISVCENKVGVYNNGSIALKK